MKYIHKTRGIITQSERRFSPLKNAMVDVFVDESGREVKLDGTEKPLDEHLKTLDTLFQKDEEERQKKELIEKENEMLVNKEKEEESRLEEERRREQEESEKKHEEILEAVKDASEVVSKSIENIPKTIIPEYPDHTEEQRKWKEEIIQALRFEFPKTDFTEVIDAIKAIPAPSVVVPKGKDYTKILSDIVAKIGGKEDFSEVIKTIQAIPEFSLPKNLLSGDRIKVEVDRVALGGNGGNGLATEAKQNPLSAYQSAGMDITANPYYFGYINSNGAWYIKKIDTTSGVLFCRGDSGYETAWAGKDGLTYGLYNVIF